MVALAPAVIFTAPELEQVVMAVPATAVGAGLIVNVLVDVALAAQGELGDAVNVRITLPAAISATLGVYVAVVRELALANVPVPLELHKTLAWLVALAPLVILTALEFEQVFIAFPATAVGLPSIV